MKQIARIFFAIAAVGLLTIYFFSDLVLFEPMQRISENRSSGVSKPTAPFHEESLGHGGPMNALVAGASSGPDGLMANGAPSSPIIHGFTGSSGGIVSSFKASWQGVYTRWPKAKKLFYKRGKSSASPIVINERVGTFLTLISLVVMVGLISLSISLVEEKARA